MKDEIRDKLSELIEMVPLEDLVYFKSVVNKTIDSRIQQSNPNKNKAENSHTLPSKQPKTNNTLKYMPKSKETILTHIIEDLRATVPVNAEAPEEKIIIPGDIADYTGYDKNNTVHVDGFLYEDDYLIDELCDEGKLSRNYCEQCGSHKTKPLNFITHSATLFQLRYIFGNNVLGDLEGKTLVDVGSRLGSVLYSGYLMTKASKLIGIEINEYFANLQKDFITKKFKFSDRVEIIHADVNTQAPLLGTADVVVMNNVFEFFEDDSERHEQLWKFIRSSVCKKGAKLVTIPALHESLEKAKVNLDLKNWVQEVPLTYPAGDDLENLQDVHLYTVL